MWEDFHEEEEDVKWSEQPLDASLKYSVYITLNMYRHEFWGKLREFNFMALNGFLNNKPKNKLFED